MPDYETARQSGAAAYDALDYLARHVRHAPNRQLYATTGELLGITRTLPDVLRKLSAVVLARNEDATVDPTSTERSGARVTEEAASQLLAAADLIDTAETRLDRASAQLSVVIWQTDGPTRHPDQPPTLTTTQVRTAEPSPGQERVEPDEVAKHRGNYQPPPDPFEPRFASSPSLRGGLSR